MDYQQYSSGLSGGHGASANFSAPSKQQQLHRQSSLSKQQQPSLQANNQLDSKVITFHNRLGNVHSISNIQQQQIMIGVSVPAKTRNITQMPTLKSSPAQQQQTNQQQQMKLGDLIGILKGTSASKPLPPKIYYNQLQATEKKQQTPLHSNHLHLIGAMSARRESNNSRQNNPDLSGSQPGSLHQRGQSMFEVQRSIAHLSTGLANHQQLQKKAIADELGLEEHMPQSHDRRYGAAGFTHGKKRGDIVKETEEEDEGEGNIAENQDLHMASEEEEEDDCLGTEEFKIESPARQNYKIYQDSPGLQKLKLENQGSSQEGNIPKSSHSSEMSGKKEVSGFQGAFPIQRKTRLQQDMNQEQQEKNDTLMTPQILKQESFRLNPKPVIAKATQPQNQTQMPTQFARFTSFQPAILRQNPTQTSSSFLSAQAFKNSIPRIGGAAGGVGSIPPKSQVRKQDCNETVEDENDFDVIISPNMTGVAMMQNLEVFQKEEHQESRNNIGYMQSAKPPRSINQSEWTSNRTSVVDQKFGKLQKLESKKLKQEDVSPVQIQMQQSPTFIEVQKFDNKEQQKQGSTERERFGDLSKLPAEMMVIQQKMEQSNYIGPNTILQKNHQFKTSISDSRVFSNNSRHQPIEKLSDDDGDHLADPSTLKKQQDTETETLKQEFLKLQKTLIDLRSQKTSVSQQQYDTKKSFDRRKTAQPMTNQDQKQIEDINKNNASKYVGIISPNDSNSRQRLNRPSSQCINDQQQKFYGESSVTSEIYFSKANINTVESRLHQPPLPLPLETKPVLSNSQNDDEFDRLSHSPRMQSQSRRNNMRNEGSSLRVNEQQMYNQPNTTKVSRRRKVFENNNTRLSSSSSRASQNLNQQRNELSSSPECLSNKSKQSSTNQTSIGHGAKFGNRIQGSRFPIQAQSSRSPNRKSTSISGRYGVSLPKSNKGKKSTIKKMIIDKISQQQQATKNTNDRMQIVITGDEWNINMNSVTGQTPQTAPTQSIHYVPKQEIPIIQSTDEILQRQIIQSQQYLLAAFAQQQQQYQFQQNPQLLLQQQLALQQQQLLMSQQAIFTQPHIMSVNQFHNPIPMVPPVLFIPQQSQQNFSDLAKQYPINQISSSLPGPSLTQMTQQIQMKDNILGKDNSMGNLINPHTIQTYSHPSQQNQTQFKIYPENHDGTPSPQRRGTVGSISTYGGNLSQALTRLISPREKVSGAEQFNQFSQLQDDQQALSRQRLLQENSKNRQLQNQTQVIKPHSEYNNPPQKQTQSSTQKFKQQRLETRNTGHFGQAMKSQHSSLEDKEVNYNEDHAQSQLGTIRNKAQEFLMLERQSSSPDSVEERVIVKNTLLTIQKQQSNATPKQNSSDIKLDFRSLYASKEQSRLQTPNQLIRNSMNPTPLKLEIDNTENKGEQAQAIMIGFEDTQQIKDPFVNKPALKNRDQKKPVVQNLPTAFKDLSQRSKSAKGVPTGTNNGAIKNRLTVINNSSQQIQLKSPSRVNETIIMNSPGKEMSQMKRAVIAITKEIEKPNIDNTKPKRPATSKATQNLDLQSKLTPRATLKDRVQQANQPKQINIDLIQNDKKNQNSLESDILDPSHNRDLPIEICLSKTHQDNKFSTITLSSMFQAKMGQKLQSNDTSSQHLVSDNPKKEKTKQELFELRKQMMKIRVKRKDDNFGGAVGHQEPTTIQIKEQKPASATAVVIGGSTLEKQQQQQVSAKQQDHVMDRLAHGQKTQIDKKEMKRLTNKNYNNLPEIKKKREEEVKKQENQARKAATQEYLKQLDETRKKKAAAVQKKRAQIIDQGLKDINV